MECKHNPEKKNQAGEFVLEVDFSELSILAMGSENIIRALERGPKAGDFTNGMDKESMDEMREVAEQITEKLDTLQDNAVSKDKN